MAMNTQLQHQDPAQQPRSTPAANVVEEQFKRHGQMVFGACLRITGNAADAEDATQAVYLALYRKAASLAGRKDLTVWLHWAAVKAGRALIRARQRRARHEEEAGSMKISGNTHSYLSEAQTKETLSELDLALEQLPTAQRQAVIRQFLGGQTQSQIASELNIPKGTVARRVNLGIEKMRQRFCRRGVVLSVAAFHAMLDEARRQGMEEMNASLAQKISTLAQRGMSDNGIPPLTESLFRSMAWRKLSFFSGWAAAALVLSLGIIPALSESGEASAPTSHLKPTPTPNRSSTELPVPAAERKAGPMGHTRSSVATASLPITPAKPSEDVRSNGQRMSRTAAPGPNPLTIRETAADGGSRRARANDGRIEADDRTSVAVDVRLTVEGPARPRLDDIRFSTFPGGRRCSFVYLGAKKPRTIQYMSKLGFKTTRYLPPGTSAADIATLENCGAEIAAKPWGTKGGYASNIEGNTLQETFDALTTSRLELQKKVKNPLLVGACDGHFGVPSFQLNRNFDRGVGYGAAYMDSHYLMAFDPSKAYCSYLGFGCTQQASTRGLNNNTIRRPPNETVYYQILYGNFEGTLRRVGKGQVVRFSLGDFSAGDLEELKENIGEFGTHPDIWHAGDGQVAAYEYVKNKVKVLGVKPGAPNEIVLSLALDRDIFPEFLVAPLSLELPAGIRVKTARMGSTSCSITTRKESVHVDIPLREALRADCEMKLELHAPDMTVPDEMKAKLTVRNTSGKTLKSVRLRWACSPGLDGSAGMTVTCANDGPFTLDPNTEKTIEVKIETAPGSRWGVSPVVAALEATVNGRKRLFMEGFEIVVAPMLRVDMDPMNRIPMKKGDYQYFEVHLANGKAPNRFIHHKAGPCQGRLLFGLPDGMVAEPAETTFELKENDRISLIVRITNNQWGEEPVRVRPLIKLDGWDRTLETICANTTIVRSKKLDVSPLDDRGLLVHASWDDKTKGGAFDRSVGPKRAYYYPGHSPAYSPNGAKRWCMETARACQIYETFKNIQHMEGTVMFWMKRDPKVRNELQVRANPANSWRQGVNRRNTGESLFVAGMTQRRGQSQGGLVIRRYPGWGGQEGWLEVVYQCLGKRLYYLQAPYVKKRMHEWRHVTVAWSVKDRRLELYLDGKLVGKAKPGKGPWHAVPWDQGSPNTGHALIVHTTDHGHWCGTMKDELYIYNRALTPAEIQRNKEKVKK